MMLAHMTRDKVVSGFLTLPSNVFEKLSTKYLASSKDSWPTYCLTSSNADRWNILCSRKRYIVMTRAEAFPELAMPEGKLVGPWKASSKVTRPIFFLYMGGMVLVVDTYLSKTLVASANALEKS